MQARPQLPRIDAPIAYTSVKVPLVPYCRYSGAMKPFVPILLVDVNLVVVLGRAGPSGQGSCSLAMPTSASLAALDLQQASRHSVQADDTF